MKKKLTEKITYEPNHNIKVAVSNVPVYEKENVVIGYNRTVTVTVNCGTDKEKLTFATDEDIQKWIDTIDFEDPQQSLLGKI